MRIDKLVRNLLLITALAFPSLLFAQFQQPTDEELKMTADPKAPGTDAVYLYREEICDGETQNVSYYERIKVLTEKGREMATIHMPYERGAENVIGIQGRTILADGSIIPLTATPDDLMNIKTKTYEEDAVVFTLPGVEVGSILEFRLTLHYNGAMPLQDWLIQEPHFIHKAHYQLRFTNYSGSQLMYTSNINPSVKLAVKSNTYTLDLTDIPHQPDEDWMPPLNIIKWHLNFFLSDFKSGKDFWETAEKQWGKAVQEATKPDGYLKTTLEQIVAPNDTDEQKARKIYAAVQKLDNTRFSRQKSRAERKKEKIKDINSVKDVWKQQSGTDDDITLLYVALARSAGLKAQPMIVVDRSKAFFDYSYLTTYQFNDYIVILNLDGKDAYLDPGQKMCPFGTLSWKHALATGLLLADKGAAIAKTPDIPFKESVKQKVADLTIDEEGNFKGTVRVMMTGQDALYWRQLALENDESELRKQFIEALSDDLPEGVQADFDHFLALDNPDTNLMAIINVSGSLGSLTGKHFFLPGLFFQSRAKHPFVAEDKRLTPIDLHYAGIEQDDVVYHLPSGYTIESAPKTSDVTWPNHTVLKINVTAKQDSVEVARTFARNFTLLDPKEYNDLHDYYLKLAEADQQQLVLVRAPVAKGN